MRNGILAAYGLMLAVSAMSAHQLTAPAADPGLVEAAKDEGRIGVRARLGRRLTSSVAGLTSTSGPTRGPRPCCGRRIGTIWRQPIC